MCLHGAGRAGADAAAGGFQWNSKTVWFGDLSLGEIAQWVEDVDEAVRQVAESDGEPIADPESEIGDDGW